MMAIRDEWAYKLVVDVAHPSGFRDRYVLLDKDLDALVGKVDGDFERYGADDDFVEIRYEWIVARSLSSVAIEVDERGKLYERGPMIIGKSDTEETNG